MNVGDFSLCGGHEGYSPLFPHSSKLIFVLSVSENICSLFANNVRPPSSVQPTRYYIKKPHVQSLCCLCSFLLQGFLSLCHLGSFFLADALCVFFCCLVRWTLFLLHLTCDLNRSLRNLHRRGTRRTRRWVRIRCGITRRYFVVSRDS